METIRFRPMAAMLLTLGFCLHAHAAAAETNAAAGQTQKILVVPQGQNGAVVNEFVTVTGEPAKAKTSATVTWDDQALTVLFVCEDAQLVATRTQRDDEDMWRDDSVEIFIDPGHTHHPMSPWLHVMVSASGGVFDEQGPVTAWYSNGGIIAGNVAFDARDLTAKVEQTANGWKAEIRITWKDIGATPKIGDVWGFNLNRTNHPEEEYLCYAPTGGPFYTINRWAHLAFADADGGLNGVTLDELSKQLEAEHERLDKSFRTFGGVEYAKVDPGEPFTPAPVAAQDWQPPEPTTAERAAGMIAYVTTDPGDYKPDRVPKPTEHASKLSTFLTPGEYEPVWLGVSALSDLRGLNVQVDVGDAPVSIDVRHMHFWPQRTGWSSRQWYITPELLLPCSDGRMHVPTTRGLLEERPFDLEHGKTAALWMTLHAAPDARPGIYKATVRVQAKDREALVLPLEIEVLSFTLQRPTDRHWNLYADSQRWANMSDEQVMAELRDFARHGMTGLNSIGLGSADLSNLKNGDVTFDASAYRRITAMAAEAGLPGPHVVRSWMAHAVRDAIAPDVDLTKGEWPQAIRDGVTVVARAAVEATRDLPPWYFYGIDEPRGENTFALQDYEAWHAGGAPTYTTIIDKDYMAKAVTSLSVPCFGVNFVVDEADRAAREAFLEHGGEFWWYGTGCYVNPFPQEAMLYHNRFGSGLLFWKSGATGQAIWTFSRSHDDVFNDFDGSDVNRVEPKEQCTTYPHLLKPDDWSTYQGAIPTIAWEALREGVDDYAYLWTLSQTIAEAEQHADEAVRKQAAEARRMLDTLTATIPWADSMGEPSIDTGWIQDVRRQVADAIVRLRSSMSRDHPSPPNL